MTEFGMKRCREAFWEVTLFVERQEPHSPECESEMGKRRNSWTRLCPQFGTVCGPFLGFSSNLFFAKPSFTPKEMRVDEKEASKVGKVIFP